MSSLSPTVPPLAAVSRNRTALFALALSTLLSSLGTSIANVSLPNLAQAFDATFAEVQWVVLAYLLTVTAFSVVAGSVGDIIGRRRLFLIGVAVFAVAALLCAAAPSLLQLWTARALQGAGAAVMLTLTLAIAAESVPATSSGSTMGVLGSTSAIGTALGPSLGGVLIGAFGWRSIFVLQASLGVLAFALASMSLPRSPRMTNQSRPRIDYLGGVLLIATLASYTLGVSFGRGSFGVMNVTLLAAAVVGATLFALVEQHSAAPLVRTAVLTSPRFAPSLLMTLLVASVAMTTLIVGPFYLSRTLGLSMSLVGSVLSIGPMVAALSSVPAGKLVDRFGAERVALGGVLGMIAAATTLALLPAAHVAAFAIPVAFLTLGYALFQTANNTNVVSAAGAERGVVSGLLNLARNIGLMTGASVAGAVFAAASTADRAPAVAAARGLHSAFGVATLQLVGALAIALIVNRRRRRIGEVA